jgi:DNA-binding TFAR19-related protein (PDSD5 family)
MDRRYQVEEADRQAQELVRHRRAFVSQVRAALAEIEAEGVTEWRARYLLARALKPHCRVRANAVRHARGQLALCLLRAYEGWPDANPLPRGERGRVSTIQMGVYDAAQAVDAELFQLTWDVADDSQRSVSEIEKLVEEMAQRIPGDR